jgi:polyisoprenoid-binding protein YceI
MKRNIFIITSLVLALAGSALATDSFSIDKSHSDVSFKVRHLVSNVTGRFGEFDGIIEVDFQNLNASSVQFSIDAASIDTDNEDRDKHLRSADFFDVEKYPEITFTSSKITKMDDNTFAVTGTFTMHGVSKTLTIPVTYLGEVKDPWGTTKAGYELATTLNRKDFGISWNKALDTGGFILGDEVQVSINLEVAKK